MTDSLIKNGATISSGDVAALIARDTKVHFNLGQDAIFTTEDKVRIVLMNCLNKLESRKAWIAPSGILMTIVAMFATANFKDFLMLKAAVWQALFIFVAVACVGWLAWAVKRNQKAPSVDDIVSEIKKSAPEETTVANLISELRKLPAAKIP